MTLHELSELVENMEEFARRNHVLAAEIRVLVYGENGVPRNIVLNWDDPVAGPVSMKRPIP